MINEYNKVEWKRRIFIGIATEGMVRIEWAAHRYTQIVPINWQCSDYTISFDREPLLGMNAIGFWIDDAYNTIIKKAIEVDAQWLLLIEDDVLIPHDLFTKMEEHIAEGTNPIVSGLYYSKGHPSEPLVFRGRGNRCFKDWKLGDRVWCDGVPFGCLLVHMSIMKCLWDNSKPYQMANGDHANKAIETPRRKVYDVENQSYHTAVGTQDLYFCDRVINEDILAKAGWDAHANMKYPLLCDTNIFCKHIDRQTGMFFPP